MEAQSGQFRPGGKIVVEWPRDAAAGWRRVSPGDEIEVAGRTLTIRGLLYFPPCYSEIYVNG
jgi:hypothetical protein